MRQKWVARIRKEARKSCLLVDLAIGIGPLSPEQVSLGLQGGVAEQVAQEWQTSWSRNLRECLQLLCTHKD